LSPKALKQIHAMGQSIAGKLAEFKRFPAVKEIRGFGLMHAIELNEPGDEYVSLAREKGLRLPLLIRFAGYTDGGGSTALYADIEKDGRAEQALNLRGRRVISWVTLERKSLARNVLERAKAAIGTGSDGVLAGALTVTGALLLAGGLAVSRSG
jgi:hypothetical protein